MPRPDRPEPLPHRIRSGRGLDLRSPASALGDAVLDASLRESLDGLIREQYGRDRLRRHGKTPARRILFAGPPGTGKTMTAEALAGSLKLPLYSIRLDSLISRFMGETAAKLRLAFNQTLSRRGVYLFDEFDAIGTKRSASDDVAEMRRALNSFLLFIEEPNPNDSPILCATNLPGFLDPALVRRFDLALRFSMPDAGQAKEVMESHLGAMKHDGLDWDRLLEAGRGLSQSELAQAGQQAVRSALLGQRDSLTTENLADALDRRRDIRSVTESP